MGLNINSRMFDFHVFQKTFSVWRTEIALQTLMELSIVGGMFGIDVLHQVTLVGGAVRTVQALVTANVMSRVLDFDVHRKAFSVRRTEIAFGARVGLIVKKGMFGSGVLDEVPSIGRSVAAMGAVVAFSRTGRIDSLDMLT